MRSVALLSIAIVSLLSVVGCSAPAAKQTATPTPMTYATVDCPPPPGGDMVFNFEGAPKATTQANSGTISYRPNVQERPSRGAVHAAY
jgi:hypothetical protein